MNKALVQNPQDDVDHGHGGDQQEAESGERRLKSLRGSLKAASDAGRQNPPRHRLDVTGGGSQVSAQL